MSSSKRQLGFTIALVVANIWAARSEAQQPAPPQGFAVERFYPSAPGGGWLVMDQLDLEGGLGAALAISSGYARKPLVVRSPDGASRLALVSDQAFAEFSAAVTYDRFRIYLNLATPLAVLGESGMFGEDKLSAPSVDLGKNPDTISDARIGFDALLFGAPKSALRLGAGAQLLIPSGDRSDYITDDTYRAMVRVLFAGDLDLFSYAGQLGVHIRPLDDLPAFGPRGSELLFGIASGPRFQVAKEWALIVGPELYGETAFRSFFGKNATGLEGLLTGRLETTGEGKKLRLKLGGGAGLDPHFGAPEWRLVLALEIFDLAPGNERGGE
jgi:hypothetical protein